MFYRSFCKISPTFLVFFFLVPLAKCRLRTRVVTCPLPQVRFGSVRPTVSGANLTTSRNSVKPGTSVFVVCDLGYFLLENTQNTSICLINGRWSNLLSRCVAESKLPVSCFLPAPCRNGHLDTRSVTFVNLVSDGSANNTTISIRTPKAAGLTSDNDRPIVAPGSLIRLTCDTDDYYTLIDGTSESVCTRNGTWSARLGICLPSQIPIGYCLVPDGIENGRVVVGNNEKRNINETTKLSNNSSSSVPVVFAKFGERIVLKCDFAFEPLGEEMATCGRYGWSNEIGTCHHPSHTMATSGNNNGADILQSRFSYSECGVNDFFISDDDRDKDHGATLSDPNEFPWMVKLEIMFENDPEFRKCGGTLIHRRYILTAAHCVTLGPIAGIIIYLGKYNMSQLNEPGEDHQVVSARRVHVHPDFNFSDMEFDFALVELNTPVFYRRQIRAICLPDEENFNCDGGANGTLDNNELKMAIPSIDSCNQFVSAGWGITKRSSTSESDVLKKFQLKYLPYSRCQALYDDAKISINDAEICAEPVLQQGQDTCEGDSGGPLICYQDGRAFLVGVTSFGAASCGDTKRPGVYSRVCRALPWIREQVSGVRRDRENRVGAMIRAALFTAPTHLPPPIVHDDPSGTIAAADENFSPPFEE